MDTPSRGLQNAIWSSEQRWSKEDWQCCAIIQCYYLSGATENGFEKLAEYFHIR